MHSFPLPVSTPEFTVSLLWHPRFQADPAHRWLRGVVLATCAASGGSPTLIAQSGGGPAGRRGRASVAAHGRATIRNRTRISSLTESSPPITVNGVSPSSSCVTVNVAGGPQVFGLRSNTHRHLQIMGLPLHLNRDGHGVVRRAAPRPAGWSAGCQESARHRAAARSAGSVCVPLIASASTAPGKSSPSSARSSA